MTKNKLKQNFYDKEATELAPQIVGKLLCVKTEDGTIKKLRITETECYFGEEDTACHAHKGKTKRTAPLFERGGIAYVYLCYGIHELFNVVTGAQNHPEAVLIRAVEGANGPGKATKALGITRKFNTASLLGDEIWLEDDGYRPKTVAKPRVGIGYASKQDQERLWRFVAII